MNAFLCGKVLLIEKTSERAGGAGAQVSGLTRTKVRILTQHSQYKSKDTDAEGVLLVGGV
jgi:hypothetical protein